MAKHKIELYEIIITLKAGDSLLDDKYLEDIKQMIKDDVFKCEVKVSANWIEQ